MIETILQRKYPAWLEIAATLSQQEYEQLAAVADFVISTVRIGEKISRW